MIIYDPAAAFLLSKTVCTDGFIIFELYIPMFLVIYSKCFPYGLWSPFTVIAFLFSCMTSVGSLEKLDLKQRNLHPLSSNLPCGGLPSAVWDQLLNTQLARATSIKTGD